MAAVFGEVTQNSIHMLKDGPVNQVPPLALLSDQARIRQLFQMKGESCGRNACAFGHHAGCHALRPSDYQGTKDFKAVLMSERRQ